uniref:Uncharacterized protein n=1 Tax=Scylla olivacea TaxID=85551 RepID=A0A0P4W0C4_SCYOL
MQQQKQNIEAPHVSYSVTELAAVVSLQRWSNLKVKVIGVLCTVDVVKRTVALHEVGIRHNPVLVMVDVESVLDVEHLEGSLVTVFGELCILHDNPCVMATIVRGCRTVNLRQHNSAMESLKKLQLPK